MQGERDFITFLAGKEKADRSFSTSYHAVVLVAMAVLVITICVGQFMWSLPENVKCTVESSDTSTDTAVIRASSLPEGVQLKVKVSEKKPVQLNPWLAIFGSLFRGSVNESAIVDATAVTPNGDGTYSVSFSSPYDAYTVSGIFYFGQSQGLLDLL